MKIDKNKVSDIDISNIKKLSKKGLGIALAFLDIIHAKSEVQELGKVSTVLIDFARLADIGINYHDAVSLIETINWCYRNKDNESRPVISIKNENIRRALSKPNIRGRIDVESASSFGTLLGPSLPEKELREYNSLHKYQNISLDEISSNLILAVNKEALKKLYTKCLVLSASVAEPMDRMRVTILRDTNEIKCSKGSREYSCIFRKTGGKNKRFEYILKIAQGSKMAASKLNSNFQTLSKEIDEINNRIEIDLALTKRFIVNDKNSGYEINERYYLIEIL